MKAMAKPRLIVSAVLTKTDGTVIDLGVLKPPLLTRIWRWLMRL
jgi:hypothetical protein